MTGIHGSNPRPAPPGATPDQDFHRQIRSDLTGFFCGNLAVAGSQSISETSRGSPSVTRRMSSWPPWVDSVTTPRRTEPFSPPTIENWVSAESSRSSTTWSRTCVGVECRRVGGGEREAARLASGAGLGQLAVGVDVRDRPAALVGRDPQGDGERRRPDLEVLRGVAELALQRRDRRRDLPDERQVGVAPHHRHHPHHMSPKPDPTRESEEQPPAVGTSTTPGHRDPHRR